MSLLILTELLIDINAKWGDADFEAFPHFWLK